MMSSLFIRAFFIPLFHSRVDAPFMLPLLKIDFEKNGKFCRKMRFFRDFNETPKYDKKEKNHDGQYIINMGLK